MSTKRLRHPGGVSWIAREQNQWGEWSVMVEPEDVLIDNHHGHDKAHIHVPGQFGRRLPVRDLGSRETFHRVVLHLMHNGCIRVEELASELGSP